MLRGYAVVFGPSDTLYRYGCYCFEFKFPTNYPFSPPKLTYMTNDGCTRFHPNLYRNLYYFIIYLSFLFSSLSGLGLGGLTP